MYDFMYFIMHLSDIMNYFASRDVILRKRKFHICCCFTLSKDIFHFLVKFDCVYDIIHICERKLDQSACHKVINAKLWTV